jgi:hypothetical protein
MYPFPEYGKTGALIDSIGISGVDSGYGVALPPRKIFSYLPPVKDALGLRTPGIYSGPC